MKREAGTRNRRVKARVLGARLELLSSLLLPRGQRNTSNAHTRMSHLPF